MRNRLLSFFLLSLCAFPMLAQSVDQRAAEHLRGFMTAHRIPGLSIAVGHRGKVVWAQAFGVSDLDTKTPVTVTSVFPLGSTTKTLTSLALGKLVEEGKLDLDAPIQKYVPYFPEKEHVITARLLAGHLAGLRDYDMAAGEYTNAKEFSSVKEAVGVFKDDPLQFVPGTRYAYSAYNFVLLSAAIEGASGRDFLTYLHQRILKPLALKHTVPNQQAAPMKGLVTSYATGFGGMIVKAPPVNVSNKWAAGGFVSTPTEMVRLGNAILAGKVVKPSTFVLLTTPQKLNDGTDTGAGYGMGWRSGTRKFPSIDRVRRVVHHGGTANVAVSFVVLIPEEGLIISIQANLLFQPFSDFSTEAYAIADLFLDASPVRSSRATMASTKGAPGR
jgi:CubicO group peptidase (beta-lactamase class C family)